MSGSIKNYNVHVNTYPINDESVQLERMCMWIKKARVFEKKHKNKWAARHKKPVINQLRNGNAWLKVRNY